MQSNEVVVVIPTRDRADLVRNAIRSVLSQGNSVQVLVSDNSISAESRSELSQYCRELGNERLRLVSPPKPLPMSQHWDWAMEQALSFYSSSHFTFLTDRMVFKPHALTDLISIITAHPDEIVCYMHDKVDDFRPPFKVHQCEWTGKLYEVATVRLLKLSAESTMYDGCVPRMLNCVAPRTVLEAIRARFGSIFSSNAPDWNFAYRVLDLLDSVFFFHKAVLVHYALRQSNGESAHRGITNRALEQFWRDLKTGKNFDAPYPEIITIWNAIISEYVSAKKEAESTKFPELNLERYVAALAAGIEYIEEPELRRDMEQKLIARGWDPTPRFKRQFSKMSALTNPGQLLGKLKSLAGSPRSRSFDTPEQALQFAVTHLRPVQESVRWEEALHQGVEVSAGPTQDSAAG